MITAMVSKKGGVGKTTSSVSLAAALARRDRRVLLVDLDSQASASLSLGVPRAALAPSIADVLLRSLAAHEAVRTTPQPGLSLITASTDLDQVDEDLKPLGSRATRLRARIAPLAGEYDFVILDCPSSMSFLPLSALIAADRFVVPVVPHFLALEGVRNLLAFADRLVHRFGTSPRLLGLLLTMVDYRTRSHRENVDRIRAEHREKVFAVEIRTNIRLAEAPAEGRTIFEHDSRSTGAAAYDLLAEEVLLRGEDASPRDSSASGSLHSVRPLFGDA